METDPAKQPHQRADGNAGCDAGQRSQTLHPVDSRGLVLGNRDTGPFASASTVSCGVLLAARPRNAMSRWVTAFKAVVPVAPAAAPTRRPRSILIR